MRSGSNEAQLPSQKEKEMKSEITESVGCRKKLRVEVEQERFDQEIQYSLRNLRKEVIIPGFRKGKAPQEILMRRYRNVIRQEALKELLPKVLQEIFESNGIKPVGEPEVTDLRVEESAPVTFNVAIDEMPSVDIEGFKNIVVAKEVTEVSDSDVDDALDRLRRSHAVQEEVDREVREGDFIVANLQKLDPTGVPIIGDRMENRIIRLDEQGGAAPDFANQVAGMRKGDQRHVRLTFDSPADDPHGSDTVEEYIVEVVRIFDNRLPEMTDDFARQHGEYEDMNDLRKQTRSRLVRQSEIISENKLRRAFIDEYVRENPFEVPNSMVERVIHSRMEDYKKQYPGDSVDEAAFHDSVRPDAVRAVQTYILMEAIKEKQGVEVSREEVNEQIEKEAREQNLNPRELRRTYIKEGLLDEIRNEIALGKAYEWIKSVVTIQEKVIPREAPQSRIIKP